MPEEIVGKMFSPEETRILRRNFVEKRLIPVLESRFQIFPELKSAAMLVAQYWQDEANDAVHLRWIFSVLETPDISSVCSNDEVFFEEDPTNLPNLPSHYNLNHTPPLPRFPSNENDFAISLFAAFCKETTGLDPTKFENHEVFAIFRKAGDHLEVDYCGEMIRPWLDGVFPEGWESQVSSEWFQECRSDWIERFVHNHKPEQQLEPEKTQELRNRILSNEVICHIRRCFQKYSELQSAALFVGQFFKNYDKDEVHPLIRFSFLESPDLEAALQHESYEADPVNLPGFFSHEELDEWGENFFWFNWNSTQSAIPAFAAFCPEGATKDTPHKEAFSPYAIFRKKSDEITIEVIGIQIRPWLDGLLPISFSDYGTFETKRFVSNWFRE